MPVPLDELMQRLPPERRAEIETNASALVADYRRRIAPAEAAAPESRVAVGIKAATGERCPESGVWKVENTSSTTMPITVDNVMPPYANRAVIWILIQHA